jgi:hypothetical protein
MSNENNIDDWNRNASDFIKDQIKISENAHNNILKNFGIFSEPLNPKIRMAQIGGPDLIGERISLEPIIDKFGNTRYIHSEGRVVKEDIYQTRIAKGYLWEELSDNLHLHLSEIKKHSF